MGSKLFAFLISSFLIVTIGVALLPIGVSLKESMWIAKKLWFSEKPITHTHLPEASLNIDYDDYRTLGSTRVQALESGVLLDSIQTYVPGELTYQGISRKVAVKLKGMRPTHWSHPTRWSYRVNILRGQEKVKELKIFSLQTPSQRGFYVDPLYHLFLEKVGVLNLKCDLLSLSVNGMENETYMIEEFFDTPMLRRKGKPNGPVLKFDFEEFWAGVDWKDPQLSGMRDSLTATYYKAPVHSYKFTSGIYKGWRSDSKEGIELLEGFRSGELQVPDVFDIETMASYFAINTLFGNQHSALLTNLRFYYNPKEKEVEPIGYDMEGIYSLEGDSHFEFSYWPGGETPKRTDFVAQVFSNELFRAQYKRVMSEVTDSSFISAVLESFEPNYAEYLVLFPNLQDKRGKIWKNAAAYRRHFDWALKKKALE